MEDKTAIFPWLEAAHTCGHSMEECANKVERHGRRCYKTHAPVHLFPCKQAAESPTMMSPECGKVVFVTRNPKSVAVSAWHHNRDKHSHHYNGPWEHFFELFMDENTPIEGGSWFDHTLAWWEASKVNPNIIVLRYEDLKKDPHKAVGELARALDIEADADVLDRVVRSSSLDAMKDQHAAVMPPNHLREGTVDGYKAIFTEEQTKIMEEMFNKKMAGSDLKVEMG